MGDDEYTASLLGEAVFGGVHDAPLDGVAQVGEARQDDREIAASLRNRRLQKPVDVLEDDPLRAAIFDDRVDRPPQDALLPFDPVGLIQVIKDIKLAVYDTQGNKVDTLPAGTYLVLDATPDVTDPGAAGESFTAPIADQATPRTARRS